MRTYRGINGVYHNRPLLGNTAIRDLRYASTTASRKFFGVIFTLASSSCLPTFQPTSLEDPFYLCNVNGCDRNAAINSLSLRARHGSRL